MADKKIPVILITGYLGSGKTTLMQNLLKQEQRKIALIVNDMGSVNIDAALLNKNRDRIASVEMVELQNGCICCTLRNEFIAEIERISQLPDIEAVFVEASGISEPSNIAASFVVYTEENPDTNVYLSSVVSVVDADRIYNEFLREISMENDTEKGDIINLREVSRKPKADRRRTQKKCSEKRPVHTPERAGARGKGTRLFQRNRYIQLRTRQRQI